MSSQGVCWFFDKVRSSWSDRNQHPPFGASLCSSSSPGPFLRSTPIGLKEADAFRQFVTTPVPCKFLQTDLRIIPDGTFQIIWGDFICLCEHLTNNSPNYVDFRPIVPRRPFEMPLLREGFLGDAFNGMTLRLLWISCFIAR